MENCFTYCLFQFATLLRNACTVIYMVSFVSVGAPSCRMVIVLYACERDSRYAYTPRQGNHTTVSSIELYI